MYIIKILISQHVVGTQKDGLVMVLLSTQNNFINCSIIKHSQFHAQSGPMSGVEGLIYCKISITGPGVY